MQQLLKCFLVFSTIFMACQASETKEAPSNETKKKAETITDPAKKLVARMVEAIGGYEKLKAQKDVEYEYTYYDTKQNLKDISTERYLFNNEASWAKYEHHKRSVMPDKEGTVIQGYDGKSTWVSLDGQPLNDDKSIKMADFLRKTNFYWFAMMFKLMDPGLNYELKPDRTVDGQHYQVVQVGFDDNVGDVQDIYVLYIHPETHLVDQFLFTVMDLGRAEPLLMKVKYTEVNGLKLPTFREYAPCDWEGNVAENANWVEEISRNVKFNNGFDISLFQNN